MTDRRTDRRVRVSVYSRCGGVRVAAVMTSVFWVGGCGLGIDDDGLPGSTVRRAFAAPFEYRDWWEEISECSGRAGNLDDVVFLVVIQPLVLGGSAFPCGDGLLCNGLWEAPHDITLAPEHIGTERLVKHEMLHDLLAEPGHPSIFEECEVDWDGTANHVPRDGLTRDAARENSRLSRP